MMRWSTLVKVARSTSNWKRRPASSACTIRWQPAVLPKLFEHKGGADMAHLGAVLAVVAPRLGGEHHELLGEAARGLHQPVEGAGFLEMVEAAQGCDDALADLLSVAVVLDDLDACVGPADFGAAEHGCFSLKSLHIVPLLCANTKRKAPFLPQFSPPLWHHIFCCSVPERSQKTRNSAVSSAADHEIRAQTVEDELEELCEPLRRRRLQNRAALDPDYMRRISESWRWRYWHFGLAMAGAAFVFFTLEAVLQREAHVMSFGDPRHAWNEFVAKH